MKVVYKVEILNQSINIHLECEKELDINTNIIIEYNGLKEYCKVLSRGENIGATEDVSFIRIATKRDKDLYLKNLRDEIEAKKKCEAFIKDLELNMSVIKAKFSFDRNQLLIMFSSEERVDFRELAKKLASVYKTRIELHQIGARDKAKSVGGVGVCGRELCCVKFLKQINSISISKAKNQNLALNPSKINGCCGRLLCCLCYEDDQYKEASKGLLTVGKRVKYMGKEAIIKGVDILNRRYKILIDDEKMDVNAEEVEYDSKK